MGKQTQSGGRPGPQIQRTVVVVTGISVVIGLFAFIMAVVGWWLELPDLSTKVVDVGSRAAKVFVLSDIYEEDFSSPTVQVLLSTARAAGIIAVALFGLRLLIQALAPVVSLVLFVARARGHHVVFGSGAAAREYARNHATLFSRGLAIHLDDATIATRRRLAIVPRTGALRDQLKSAAAFRARRIVVDEHQDADTWEIAQAIARECERSEVLAHIGDDWMRDRLSRELPTFKLTSFSYAGGAARQVLLAHPPYLLAKALGSKAQHILVVGFGQVGQAIAREFIITSTVSDSEKMLVTVVDPAADSIRPDFHSRHDQLLNHIDFQFFAGDFRLNDPTLFDRIKARNAEIPVCAVYIAVDEEHDPQNLAYVLTMQAQRHVLFQAPVFFCAQHGAGLSPVRQGAGYVGGAETEQGKLRDLAMRDGRLHNLRIVSFGSWRQAFDGAGLLEKEYDAQARRFHASYEQLRVVQAKEKNPAAPPPPPQPWAMLPDQLRVSNRRVAAHIRAKAFAAGFDLGQWLDARDGGWMSHELPPAGDVFRTEDAGLMLGMGRLEHYRWTLDRFFDGWRLGPRDNYARTRADLVPFDQLPPEAVHKDDDVIRVTKALLDNTESRSRRKQRTGL